MAINRNPRIYVTAKALLGCLKAMNVKLTEEEEVELLSALHRSREPDPVVALEHTKRQKETKQMINKVVRCKLPPEQFAEAFYQAQISHRFRGVTLRTPESSDWSSILSMAEQCYEFIKAYAHLGADVNVYANELVRSAKDKSILSFILKEHDKIVARWRIKDEIKNKEDNPQETRMCWHFLSQEYKKRFGTDGIISDASSQVHMLRIRLMAKEQKADLKEWIIAQFEKLSFTEQMPHPSVFYNESAKIRYYAHVGHKNKKEEEDFMNL